MDDDEEWDVDAEDRVDRVEDDVDDDGEVAGIVCVDGLSCAYGLSLGLVETEELALEERVALPGGCDEDSRALAGDGDRVDGDVEELGRVVRMSLSKIEAPQGLEPDLSPSLPGHHKDLEGLVGPVAGVDNARGGVEHRGDAGPSHGSHPVVLPQDVGADLDVSARHSLARGDDRVGDGSVAERRLGEGSRGGEGGLFGLGQRAEELCVVAEESSADLCGQAGL